MQGGRHLRGWHNLADCLTCEDAGERGRGSAARRGLSRGMNARCLRGALWATRPGAPCGSAAPRRQAGYRGGEAGVGGAVRVWTVGGGESVCQPVRARRDGWSRGGDPLPKNKPVIACLRVSAC